MSWVSCRPSFFSFSLHKPAGDSTHRRVVDFFTGREELGSHDL